MKNKLTNFKFSPLQEEIIELYHNFNPKILILQGAIRSGKTLLNCFLFIFHILKLYKKNEIKDYIISGYTLGSIKRNVLPLLKQIYKIDIKLDNNNCFKFYNQNINCFGTSNKASYKAIHGMTAYGALINEATLQNKDALEVIIQRCSGQEAKIFIDTNPDHPEHWFKKEYIDLEKKIKINDRYHFLEYHNKEILKLSSHFKIFDNKYLDSSYIASLSKDTKSLSYKRNILGEWVLAHGVVFDEFRYDKHVQNIQLQDNFRLIRVIDYGFIHPFVCLWIALDNNDIMMVYREYNAFKKSIKEQAEAIIFLSKYEKYENNISDHNPQLQDEFLKYNIKLSNADKRDRKMSIIQLKERIKNNAFFIDLNCKNTIKELMSLKWREGSSSLKEELPLKENDDNIDCCLYANRYFNTKQKRGLYNIKFF